MITFKTIPEVNNVALINVGCTQIGYLNRYNDYYSVSVLYHTFKVKNAYKSAMRQMIESSYNSTQYFLEAERLKIPIRINRSLDRIPQGRTDLKIIG